jgi:hypothetical protein
MSSIYDRKKMRGRERKKTIYIGLSVVILILIAAIVWFILGLHHFEVRKIAVEPAEVNVGNPVIISAQVENGGSSPGEYVAELKIQGSVIEKKALNIPAKTQQTVSFSYVPTSAGTYNVVIGQATATFDAEEGLLPSWYNGDTWTYRVNIGTEQYEVTYEVLGETIYEGTPIYVLRVSTKSQSEPYDRGTSFVSKNTLSVTEEERLGKVNDIPVYQKTVVDSNIVDGAPWPLALGNTWTERDSKDITTKNGLLISAEKVDTTHTFNVEGIEDITTPAGVFHCFKIVERDEENNIVGTSWYSDKIKRETKRELVLNDNTYSFDIASYKVATSPPKVVPKVDVQKFTMYEDKDSGYVVYYQSGWQLEPKEEGAVHIFTTAGANGISYGSIRIRVVTVPETQKLDLDVVYKDILAETTKNDPAFALIDSSKIPAELPWYQLRWSSKFSGVDTRGKTMLVVKGQKLFIITGWVQQSYEKTYWPQLEQITGSFGINE